MRIKMVALGFGIVSLMGCASTDLRTAHVENGRVCVEPKPIDNLSVEQSIVWAAGYLACRDAMADEGNSDAVLPLSSQLTAILALDIAGSSPPLLRGDKQIAEFLAATCRAAERELVRHRYWPSVGRIVQACNDALIAGIGSKQWTLRKRSSTL